MSQTSQNTVNKYNKGTVGNSQTVSQGTRSSQNSRSQSSESIRALTNQSTGNSRDIQRANIAMQITFTIPITSEIPVNPNANC